MLPVDEIRLNFNPASLAVLNAVLAFLMYGICLLYTSPSPRDS